MTGFVVGDRRNGARARALRKMAAPDTGPLGGNGAAADGLLPPIALAPGLGNMLSMQRDALTLLAAHVDQLAAALEEQTQATRQLATQVSAKQTAIESLTHRLAELEAAGRNDGQNRRGIPMIPGIGDTLLLWENEPGGDTRIAELSAQLRSWEEHWVALQHTRAWRFAMAIRHLRERCAPDGSRRVRVWYALTRWARG